MKKSATYSIATSFLFLFLNGMLSAQQTVPSNTLHTTNARFNPLHINQRSNQFMKDQLLGDTKIEANKNKKLKFENAYTAPIVVTNDGNTAYYSKPIEIKPLYGVFSKKEIIYKLFSAEKVNGRWQNVKQLHVCPKYASAMHPAVSSDGQRLFFASDMPGTFGAFDIYVSEIKSDGTMGVAKNLGLKVNTVKNDLYPKVMESGALFFASEGRDGYGGLDIYLTQVGQRSVELAVNLGNPVNSKDDDFALTLMADQGMAYVMSNRNKSINDVQRIAFSFSKDKKYNSNYERDYNLLAAFNDKMKIEYTSSVFEDE